MRKIIVSGAVAFGLLAVAMTVMGHPVSYNQADRGGRPLLVADDGGSDSRPSASA